MKISARKILEEHTASDLGEVSPVVTPAMWRRRDCACGVCDMCRHFVGIAIDQATKPHRESMEHGTRRDEPYSSTAHALGALLAYSEDGAPVLGLGDPDRLSRIMHLGRGGSARDANPGPAARQVEDLALVRKALSAVRPSECRGMLDAEAVQGAVLMHYARGAPWPEVAERIGARMGWHVPEKLIASEGRRAHQMVYESLRARGLVPRAQQTKEAEEMDGSELKQWKDVAAFLGVSVSTARRWARDMGLPVFKLGGRVVTSARALESWQAENAMRVGNGEQP